MGVVFMVMVVVAVVVITMPVELLYSQIKSD